MATPAYVLILCSYEALAMRLVCLLLKCCVSCIYALGLGLLATYMLLKLLIMLSPMFQKFLYYAQTVLCCTPLCFISLSMANIIKKLVCA